MVGNLMLLIVVSMIFLFLIIKNKKLAKFSLCFFCLARNADSTLLLFKQGNKQPSQKIMIFYNKELEFQFLQ